MTGQALRETGEARTSVSRARYVAAGVIALAGEALVASAALTPGVSVATPILLHVATVAWIAALVLLGHEGDGDNGLAMIVLLVIAVCGPAGAIAALGTLAMRQPGTEDKKILDNWYLRLGRAGAPAPAKVLLERIVSGRVQRPETVLPSNFLEVLESGTLDERQMALGLIARQFHPDYSRVLQVALRNPEPVVRVQASAVVARVREDLKARVGALMAELSGASRMPNIASVGELHALQACPFVELTQRLRCRQMTAAILDASLERGGDVVEAAARADRAGLTAIETFLIEQKRYKDFRVARRVGQLSARSWLKLRRITARGAA